MKRFVNTVIIFTLILIGFGAWTRLSDSGLGCPDWPGCYGYLMPPQTQDAMTSAQTKFGESVELEKAWVEMGHRYLAGLLGLMIVALFIFGVRARKYNPALLNLGILLCVAVVVQALFGMWTVTLKLWPQVVTMHLAGGMFILTLLVLYRSCLRGSFALPVFCVSDRHDLVNLRKYFWLLFVLLWAQVLLGGWVSSNYAAAACYDFPACQGQLWPPQDYASGFNIFQSVGPNYLGGQIDNPGKTAVHVFHRVWAVVLSIACVFVFVAWWRRFIFLRRYVALLSILLAFQVLLGVMNVLGGFPLWLGAAHNVMAALLILCFSNLGAWLCLKK